MRAGTYIGCFAEPWAYDTDGQFIRSLPYITMSYDMTVEQCMAHAERMGYQYAAVQYYHYCFGGKCLEKASATGAGLAQRLAGDW